MLKFEDNTLTKFIEENASNLAAVNVDSSTDLEQARVGIFKLFFNEAITLFNSLASFDTFGGESNIRLYFTSICAHWEIEFFSDFDKITIDKSDLGRLHALSNDIKTPFKPIKEGVQTYLLLTCTDILMCRAKR